MAQVTEQVLYGGVRLLGSGPDLNNIAKLDFGALPMVSYMQRRGLQVDLNHFMKMEKELAHDLDELTAKVHTITGYHINLDSGDQVADLLFKKLKLKQLRPKLTSTGDRESVEDEVLTAIQHDHQVVPVIKQYKQYSKLLGTYVRPMPKLAKRSKFGVWRIHPNFNVCRVPSGRLACKQPNLLAMPNRSKRGRQVCEGFITDEGWTLLSVDESQIEPRLAAHLSQDKNLLRIYHNEEDIYSDFAIAAFKLKDLRYECNGYGNLDSGTVCDNKEHQGHGWHYPGVDKKKHRFPAKTCVLASIYEVTGSGLLEQMPTICANCLKDAVDHDCGSFRAYWTEEMCDKLIVAFGEQYEGVIEDRMRGHDMARRNSYVWDMWGRILHTAAVRSVHPWVVRAALREAGNFFYQAGAQGTIKLVMAQTYWDFEKMKILGDVYHPLLQIHDEIFGEVRNDVLEEIAEHMVGRFEGCVKLNVPIKASWANADNWGILQK